MMSPDDYDQFFRVNVRGQREYLGLSQADLAERMRGLGVRYHPNTVTRLENGERTVRLGEALMIAQALEFPLHGLYTPPGSSRDAARLDDAAGLLVKAERDLDLAVRAFLGARRELSEVVAELVGDGYKPDSDDTGIGGELWQAANLLEHLTLRAVIEHVEMIGGDDGDGRDSDG